MCRLWVPSSPTGFCTVSRLEDAVFRLLCQYHIVRQTTASTKHWMNHDGIKAWFRPKVIYAKSIVIVWGSNDSRKYGIDVT